MQYNIGRKNDILTAFIDGCTNLKSLLLEQNSIESDEGISAIADFLVNNTTLNVFSYWGNHVGKEKSEVLSKALKKNTKLREISLGATGISLPHILSKHVTQYLTTIDLSSNNLKTVGGKLVAAFLKRNPAVIDLNLSANGIPSGSAATALCEALKANTNLQHLDLRHNYFGDKTIPALVDTLRNSGTIPPFSRSNCLTTSSK